MFSWRYVAVAVHVVRAIWAMTRTRGSLPFWWTFWLFVVMFHRAPTAAWAAVLQPLDVAVDSSYLVLAVASGGCFVEAVVVEAAGDHVGGGGSVVVARLPIESLPLVAPVLDAFASAVSLKRRVCEDGHRSRACSIHSRP